MIKDIKISNFTSFILLENGDLWGCGFNEYGELGLGRTKQVNTFVKICEDVEKIKCYIGAIFLFKKDKTLWFAGYGFYLNSVINITSFIKIADQVEDVFFWELRTEGKFLLCLKNNGDLVDLIGNKINLSNVKKVIEGVIDEKSCLFFIKKDNSLFYFRKGSLNEIKSFNKVKNVFSSNKFLLFIQKSDDSLWKVEKSNFKESIKIFDNIKDVKISPKNSFFLKKDGDLFVLGKNDYGELGTNEKEVNIPMLVAKDVKEIYSNYYFTLILKNDNSLWGCGENIYNVLGNEPKNCNFHSFKKICNDVKKTYVDMYFLFIIKQNDELWGSGNIARYFQGNNYLKFISNNVKNVFSDSLSSFVFKKDNFLLCFGNNTLGQLGIGSKKDEINKPTECTAIKNYYDTKETVKVIKNVFKERGL